MNQKLVCLASGWNFFTLKCCSSWVFVDSNRFPPAVFYGKSMLPLIVRTERKRGGFIHIQIVLFFDHIEALFIFAFVHLQLAYNTDRKGMTTGTRSCPVDYALLLCRSDVAIRLSLWGGENTILIAAKVWIITAEPRRLNWYGNYHKIKCILDAACSIIHVLPDDFWWVHVITIFPLSWVIHFLLLKTNY